MNKDNKDAAEGCFSLVTLIFALSGLFEIAQGNYLIALLYCAPLICWILFVLVDFKSLKSSAKIMPMAIFLLVTLFYTVGGIVAVVFENYFNALLSFTPLICCVFYVIYYLIAVRPKQKRWYDLQRMYNLPNSLEKENGRQWGQAFLHLLITELKNVSESDKKNDLLQCHHIVKKMIKDESFKDIHRAFMYTGCHFLVTDKEGNIITKIV